MIHETALYASSDGVAQTDHGSRFLPLKHTEQRLQVIPYYWDPVGLTYVVAQQAGGGGGGGGDASAANQTTEIARLTSILTELQGKSDLGETQPVSLATNTPDVTDRAARLLGHVTVDGSALPTGAATEATLALVAGTDIAAPTAMPAGGVGIRGWLSAIWTKLNGSIVVTQATPANLQATVQGTVELGATSLAALETIQVGSSALPAGASTEATLALIKAKTDNLDVLLSSRTKPADVQVVSELPATTVSSVLQTTANTVQANAINLAAPGAGLFHIIQSITITRVNNTAAAVAGDTTVRQITSGNLNGWAHEMGSALIAGGSETIQYLFSDGLKSQVANTATTISLPAGGAGTKIRITVTYRIGA